MASTSNPTAKIYAFPAGGRQGATPRSAPGRKHAAPKQPTHDASADRLPILSATCWSHDAEMTLITAPQKP